MNSEVEVTQEDRDAAADLLDELSGLLDHNGIGQVADLIRDGEYDEHEATQAFARHRTAALRQSRAAAVEECAGVARERLYPKNPVSDWTEFAYERAQACEQVEAALRALAPQTDGGGA